MRKTFLLSFVCSLFLAAAAQAQPVGFGLKAGAPLTDVLSVNPSGALQYVTSTNRFTIGPFVEFRLPGNLAIEVDALYKSFDYQRVIPSNTGQSASSWEFPVLGKYRLLGGPIRPYIEGGVAFSRITNIPDVLELARRNNYGVVFGAGVELKVGPLRIAPELRYNGWTRRNFDAPLGTLQSNRNQASVLVGISF
jgi:opacity protein-like surface antigen